MKLTRTFLFILLVTIISLPMSSSAIPNLGTFQHNLDIELKQTCTINGTFCDFCNISSVDYPNGSRIITDVLMTKRQADFNYTLSDSDTYEVFGEYKVNGYCTFGSDVIKNWVYYLDVTRSGKQLTTAQGIVYVIILFISILIFMFISTGAFFMPSGNERNEENKVISISDLKYVKMVLFAFSYLLFMWIIFMLMELASNFMAGDTASRIFIMIFYTLFYSLVPLFLGFIIFFVMLKFQDRKFNDMLQRGIFVDKV